MRRQLWKFRRENTLEFYNTDSLLRSKQLWLVTPRPPPTVAPLTLPVPAPAGGASSSSSSKPNPQSSTSSASSKPFNSNENPDPKVEYLATLNQHTGVVNCVRFCPTGDTLASAGDDGNILLWVPGEGSKKIGESEEDRAYERESWRVKSMIR
jgi:chromatin assembly factor 1 subunit B